DGACERTQLTRRPWQYRNAVAVSSYGKTYCKLVVCDSMLLFPSLGNSDQYNGIALRSPITG
ncbi:hypothetical protein QUA30_25900, partial [Microcoleus sp. Pol14C2]|uniref:hypothetical protein n=1 Tax=unclassified Microcoleus TaxID=2642155 RepID=UPI002FD603A5